MSAPYRVGVVGSRWGGEMHVPALRAQGRFEVVAIASPRHASEVARQRRVPHAFDSIDAMLAGVDLDVVTIASPPFAHADQLHAALAAGKHVLCEKPLALDVAQAQAMRDAASRAHRVVAIAHELRFLPCVIAMRELIANGHLGALREIEVTSFTSALRATSDRPPSWWFDRARGGGQTGAMLSHLVDLAIYLADRRPLRVVGLERTANGARVGGGHAFRSDVADGAFAVLDFGDGLVARLATDATRAVESATIAVHGETRTAVAAGHALTQTTTFTVDDEETDELELRPSPHAHLGAVHPQLPYVVDLLDRFVAAIDGQRVFDLPTLDDGLTTQCVLAEIGYG